ncbi:MAG: AMP-binding protein [Alphaproteobacteria bacterium]
MSKFTLPRDTLLRVIMSAVAAELRDGCGRTLEPATIASWTPDTDFGEQGLDLDSLELLACAGRINQLFHMHEAGIEDYLLRDRSFGQWAQIVEASLGHASDRLTFLTSGSTGEPKPCTHDTALLAQEIAAFAPLLAGTTRIIACVPGHHIYGFLFTALMPQHLDVPVIEGRFLSPGQWTGLLQRGDLIVSSPSFWQYLARSLPAFPDGVAGLTSTAPMPRALADTLTGNGLSRLIEIYGSSETAGVGWRDDPGAPYTLLPFWHSAPDSRLRRSLPDGTDGEPQSAMDLLIWEPPAATERSGPTKFRPAGRRDNAVQIGGTNVFPARIAAVICDHDLVARCTVRRAQDTSVDRLKAHIVLKGNIDPTPAIVRDIEAWCRDHLKVAERPRLLCFGDDVGTEDQAGAPLRQASGF